MILRVGSAKDIYLAGTGSFALEIADWAQAAGWRVAGLIELLDPGRVGSTIDGLLVLDPSAPIAGESGVAIALAGDRHGHWSLLEPHGWSPASVVHPLAHLSASARLEPGCVVGPGVAVGAHTVLGAHTLVSRGSLIGHHTALGAYVTVNPGGNIAGNVVIGERAFIGMGAIVVNNASVGAGATVAAGSLVLKDVAAGVRVQGVPAREYRDGDGDGAGRA